MFVSTWIINVLLITRVTNIPVLISGGTVVTSATVVKLVFKVTSAMVLRVRQNC